MISNRYDKVRTAYQNKAWAGVKRLAEGCPENPNGIVGLGWNISDAEIRLELLTNTQLGREEREALERNRQIQIGVTDPQRLLTNISKYKKWDTCTQSVLNQLFKNEIATKELLSETNLPKWPAEIIGKIGPVLKQHPRTLDTVSKDLTHLRKKEWTGKLWTDDELQVTNLRLNGKTAFQIALLFLPNSAIEKIKDQFPKIEAVAGIIENGEVQKDKLGVETARTIAEWAPLTCLKTWEQPAPKTIWTEINMDRLEAGETIETHRISVKKQGTFLIAQDKTAPTRRIVGMATENSIIVFTQKNTDVVQIEFGRLLRRSELKKATTEKIETYEIGQLATRIGEDNDQNVKICLLAIWKEPIHNWMDPWNDPCIIKWCKLVTLLKKELGPKSRTIVQNIAREWALRKKLTMDYYDESRVREKCLKDIRLLHNTLTNVGIPPTIDSTVLTELL